MATLPDRLTDLLDAVNVLLSSIGEAPVSTLDNSEAPDVASALNLLNEKDKEVQSAGLESNTDEKLTILRDAAGEIILPLQTLRVDTAYWQSSGAVANVTARGNKLYNKDDHTFTFTDDVQVDIVVRLDFSELPEVVRRYITISAAQEFQGRYQGSTTVDRILDRTVAKAKAAMEEHEDEVADRSQVSGNAAVMQALHGTHGLRRNRRR